MSRAVKPPNLLSSTLLCRDMIRYCVDPKLLLSSIGHSSYTSSSSSYCLSRMPSSIAIRLSCTLVVVLTQSTYSTRAESDINKAMGALCVATFPLLGVLRVDCELTGCSNDACSLTRQVGLPLLSMRVAVTQTMPIMRCTTSVLGEMMC